MDKKLYFLLGIHNHQPVGNFAEVLEKALALAYRPFLEVMERHPKIKWSLHCSGILWDFFGDKHPEYLESIRQMHQRGQLELLSAGYYEPILPVIPENDRRGQILMLNEYLQKQFSARVRGGWLTERVWEPHLPKDLVLSGLEYTLVDDRHFVAAGFSPEELQGYYVTEDENYLVKIFPISQKLRYYIPFAPVDKVLEYFQERLAKNPSPVIALTMGDDGEKFGMWPKTHEHVYKDKWLDNFLTRLENTPWIETLTFSDYLDRFGPQGRVYLPTASYLEMTEWALPTKTQEIFEQVLNMFKEPHQEYIRRFLSGGFWRNFLTKYSEANQMHKKMLRVSQKVKKLESKKNKTEKDKKILQLARNHLYQGQCNCAYWHGVFGGLYLPHLRQGVYQNLLLAEKALAPGKGQWVRTDFDADGLDEYIWEGSQKNIYVSPARGGRILEIDGLDIAENFTNVLTRRPEAYHQKLRQMIKSPGSGEVQTIHEILRAKEENLDRYLHYDWYERNSLLDHFFHPDTTLEKFYRAEYGEQGDFVLEAYRAEISAGDLNLSRQGTVWQDNRPLKIVVEKKIIPGNPTIKFVYRITNCSETRLLTPFGTEFNLAVFSGEKSESPAIKEWVSGNLSFQSNLPLTLWVYPLETVSLSEDGFERTRQGTCFTFVSRLNLQPGEIFSLVLQLTWKKL